MPFNSTIDVDEKQIDNIINDDIEDIIDKERECREKIQKMRFKFFEEIVKKNGGTCIGTFADYQGVREPISVKCKDGHEWKISPNNLEFGRWCPICKANIGELIAHAVCEFLFGKKFKKVRPNWLKNDKNNNLELDMFNDDLKLAIEYNGIQHYKYIPFFHRTETNFHNRVSDDNIKIEKCKEMGIYLIIVPYNVKNENICRYIFDQVTKLNIPMVNDPKNIDFSNLRSSMSLTEKTEKIIKEKEGKLLGGSFFCTKSKISVQCKKGHEWETSVKSVNLNRWCIMCSNEMTDEKRTKISEGLSNFLQTEEGKKSKKKSMEKRSETMEKQRITLRENITTKECGNCTKLKPVADFDKKSAAKDGLQTNCKTCVKELKTEWRANKRLKCEKFSCDQCDKIFDLKDSLTRHKKSHIPSSKVKVI